MITHLEKLAPQLDEDLVEELTQLAARFQLFARERRLGILYHEEQTVQRERIIAALGELIRQIPEEKLAPGFRWQ